jgi:hypothetical protein
MKYPKPRKWVPLHPEKYKGDATNIIARSSWEIKFFIWCDRNPAVLSWSSEEFRISYLCPTDNRYHFYYPDGLIQVKDNAGDIKTYLVEIKPACQTVPPSPPKRKTKRYISEVMTWGKNDAKWKHARNFCKSRGWEFVILTEFDLGIK